MCYGNDMAKMNYLVVVPGGGQARAGTIRTARKAFGRIANDAPVGTIGEITNLDGDLVEQGVVASCGWYSTTDYALEDAIRLAAGERPGPTFQPRRLPA